MADNLLLPVTLGRILDSNGDPVSGAKVNVYDAGTTDAKNVWTDKALTSAAANPIVADSGGYLAARYIGTGDYKLVVTESDDTVIKTEDNLPGALDTSGYSSDTAIPTSAVVSKIADYTVLTTDQYKTIIGNCTGGDIDFTLPSAVTAADGWMVILKHGGTANVCKVSPVSSQTVDGEDSFVLRRYGEAVTLVSDGANWNVQHHSRGVGQGETLYIVDRDLTAPPMSPAIGARYILGGTGTGDWSAFSDGDVLESDGGSVWIQIAPFEGMRAWIEDENVSAEYTGSAWKDTDVRIREQAHGRAVQAANTIKTDTETISVTAGSWADIPDFSVELTGVDTNNHILVTGTVSIGATVNSLIHLQVCKGGSAMTAVIGAAASNRLRSTSGGGLVDGSNTIQSVPIAFVDESPSATSTYTIKLTGTTDIYYLNRTGTDTDSTSFARSISFLRAEEILQA